MKNERGEEKSKQDAQDVQDKTARRTPSPQVKPTPPLDLNRPPFLLVPSRFPIRDLLPHRAAGLKLPVQCGAVHFAEEAVSFESSVLRKNPRVEEIQKGGCSYRRR